MADEKPPDGLLSYPLPLPGRQYPGRAWLPRDLRAHEVERLTAFLRTLVIPDKVKP